MIAFIDENGTPLREIMTQWLPVCKVFIPLNYFQTMPGPPFSTHCPILSQDALEESAWIVGRYLNRFLAMTYNMSVEPNRLFDEMRFTIDGCNQQLFESKLYTFGIKGAYRKKDQEVIFDFQSISEDLHEDITKRTMRPIQWWDQKDEFYSLLINNIDTIE